MMKKIIVYSCLFVAILLNATSIQAQEVNDNSNFVASQDSTEQKVFDVAEQMPSFPGGQAALFAFLAKTIKYPVEAEENNIQGRVIVTFIVERDGTINDVTVAKSVDPSLDREAVRVVKNMPNWIPGKQNGETIRVKYTVPVTFRLQPAKILKDPKQQSGKKWTGKPLTPWNK